MPLSIFANCRLFFLYIYVKLHALDKFFISFHKSCLFEAQLFRHSAIICIPSYTYEFGYICVWCLFELQGSCAFPLFVLTWSAFSWLTRDFLLQTFHDGRSVISCLSCHIQDLKHISSSSFCPLHHQYVSLYHAGISFYSIAYCVEEEHVASGNILTASRLFVTMLSLIRRLPFSDLFSSCCLQSCTQMGIHCEYHLCYKDHSSADDANLLWPHE